LLPDACLPACLPACRLPCGREIHSLLGEAQELRAALHEARRGIELKEKEVVKTHEMVR
jgi:hypothetical protein